MIYTFVKCARASYRTCRAATHIPKVGYCVHCSRWVFRRNSTAENSESPEHI